MSINVGPLTREQLIAKRAKEIGRERAFPIKGIGDGSPYNLGMTYKQYLVGQLISSIRYDNSESDRMAEHYFKNSISLRVNLALKMFAEDELNDINS